jgi:long-chain acyl-CoA synthetase
MSGVHGTARPSDIGRLLHELREEDTAHGEAAALTFYKGRRIQARLSYRAWLERIDAWMGRLGEYGVEPGEKVALLSRNALDVPTVVMALLARGAVVVPLNPGLGGHDWSYPIEHSGARLLLTSSELADAAAAALPASTRRLAIDRSAPTPTGIPHACAPELDPSSGAILLYTSGTTGTPKAVLLSHRNLIENASALVRNFELQRSTQLAVLPLHHAHAFGFGLMTSVLSGGHLVFSDGLDPFSWAHVIEQQGVTITSVVPHMLPVLLRARIRWSALRTLRCIMVSSAPLASTLAREFQQQSGVRLIQGWGLSEYTNFACITSPSLGASQHEQLMFGREVPSVGTALPGTDVRVVDSSGNELPDGERGELVVNGPCRMLGYFRDPVATGQAIRDGWLHTGDEGYALSIDGQRHFFISGRIKELIIRAGEKISPLAVERRLAGRLRELTPVSAAVGFTHDALGEEIGLYVEAAAPSQALLTELRHALLELPVAVRPKVVLYGADPIPRTHTGKIQRRRLAQRFDSYARYASSEPLIEAWRTAAPANNQPHDGRPL